MTIAVTTITIAVTAMTIIAVTTITIAVTTMTISILVQTAEIDSNCAMDYIGVEGGRALAECDGSASAGATAFSRFCGRFLNTNRMATTSVPVCGESSFLCLGGNSEEFVLRSRFSSGLMKPEEEEEEKYEEQGEKKKRKRKKSKRRREQQQEKDQQFQMYSLDLHNPSLFCRLHRSLRGEGGHGQRCQRQRQHPEGQRSVVRQTETDRRIISFSLPLPPQLLPFLPLLLFLLFFILLFLLFFSYMLYAPPLLPPPLPPLLPPPSSSPFSHTVKGGGNFAALNILQPSMS